MKIHHREYGEVDGVMYDSYKIPAWMREWAMGSASLHTWIKDGVRYFPEDGWSEVKEKQWVDVTGLCSIDQEGDLSTPGGYVIVGDDSRFRKVEMYDLPDNLLHDVYSMTSKGFVEYIQRFKKPCLIVEQEQ